MPHEATTQCTLCGASSQYISKELGICLRCIRERPTEALPLAAAVHTRSREPFGLPTAPPRAAHGILCDLCVNECRIPEGAAGYCGVRQNRGGKLFGTSLDTGHLSWYHDPLPTNCVADWVCPGGTGAGFPEYGHRSGPEHGYTNLAVFFESCSFNCLYCQNWHFRKRPGTARRVAVRELVAAVDDKTACVCHFGGDPTPQLPFALNASRKMRETGKGRILRVCWETNGAMHQALLDQIIDLSLPSGGCIKFDLKAWSTDLHMALTGITNERTFANFRRAAEKMSDRPVPPPLIANTLLVPGYTDEEEVRQIARFIASVNTDIPYSLLAFHPHFFMSDLPLTPRLLAERCVAVAREEGISEVRVGNVHLLR
ncbi:MAG: radical SAM protein [Chloroflexota bacterium]